MSFVKKLGDVFTSLNRYFTARGDHAYQAEFCGVCRAHKKPNARGLYLVRTGLRKGCTASFPLPIEEVYVCPKHHPSQVLEGAEWSSETDKYFESLGLAPRIVYPYVYRQ